MGRIGTQRLAPQSRIASRQSGNDRMKSALLKVIDTDVSGMAAGDFSSWLGDNKRHVEKILLEQGAVLFRGTEIRSHEGFEQVCRSMSPDLRRYVGGGSPRSHLGGNIYTSTEYSARVPIPLHCEATYFPNPPDRIWFYCHRTAESGGETPIGNMARFAEVLDTRIVDRFREEGVLYVMNLSGGDGFGKSWMQVYECADQNKIEATLISQGAGFTWTDDGGLRVELRAPAIAPHPETGVEVWLSQAVNWHPAHLGPGHYERLLKLYGGESQFPKIAFYGDGAPIGADDITYLTGMQAAREVVFTWRQGDILLLDNSRIAHGRRPFIGDRAIYVGMA